jgi:hypothetical protein
MKEGDVLMNASVETPPEHLSDLKVEFANETGSDMSQYNKMDKANLTSRQNGYVGGYIGGIMTKKLTEMAKQQLNVDKQ